MGHMSRAEAEDRLGGEITGGFLIRRGQAGGDVLSFKDVASVKHFKLEARAGQISSDGKTFFPNIAAFVDFYKVNPIPGTLNIRLR